MLQKYQVEITTKNVYPYKYNLKKLLNTKEEVNSSLKDLIVRLKYMSDEYKYSKGFKKIAQKLEENKELSFYNLEELQKEINYYKAKIGIVVKPVSISTKRDNTLFVEVVHTSLRKFCEGAGANGLWHWINFCADNPKYSGIITSFWDMLIASFRQAKKYRKKLYNEYNEEESLNKLTNYIYEVFKLNMDSYYMYKGEGRDNHEGRAQYFIMMGLFEAMMNRKDYPFSSVVYQVVDEKII